MILLSSLVNFTIGQDYCDPAQRPPSTVEGGFTVSAKRICVGAPITVTNTKLAATSIKYIYGYTKDSSLVSSGTAKATYTFPKPGRYKILQAGSLNATAMLHCEEIEVLPLDPISITIKSCSGRKVTVVPDVATLGQYDTYVISWNDGNIEEVNRAAMEANPEHTYNDNGSDLRTITVEGVYGTVANPLCKTPFTQTVKLTPAATQPAITTLKTASDNSITLQYRAGVGDVVQLYQKVNGVYVGTGQKSVGSGTFTVQTDAKQTQCFQVVAEDICSNSGLKSDEVCSLVLDVKAAYKQNNLSWQPYAGAATNGQFLSYRLTRNNTPIGGTLTDQNIASYTDDNAIECGTQYCYSLVARIAGSIAQTDVTSASVCVTGINGIVPDNVDNVLVSVENNHPKLVATLPNPVSGPLSSYTLTISRADGSSGTFRPVGAVVNDNTFVDNSADASAGSYCYQITYQGICGLTLPPSKPVCTVWLTSNVKTRIDWTSESPFALGPVATYTVELTNSLTGTNQTIPLGSSTRYELDPNDPNAQAYTYRIIATAGGKTSYSNFFTFPSDAKIWVPDAFTPNGDNINDEFLPIGVFDDRFLMNVYSRWGEVVYSTTDKTKGWDGLINGEPALSGQYIYRIEMEDTSGQKTVRTGAVLLIR